MTDPGERLRLIKYGILQTTLIPSLICDLFVFAYFIRRWRKEIITAPHNHVIFCLLSVTFAQKVSGAPFLLHYFRWGVVLRQTSEFCAFWNWLDYSLVCIPLQLLAWCCIERHLFVFHGQAMKKLWCLTAFHYAPLLVCLTYVSIFYATVVLFPTSCANHWDYTIVLCGGACFTFQSVLGTFDCLFHYGVPILIILLANMCLYCRVIWQKLKQERSVQWARQRRLIIQLSFISILFLVALLPLVIVCAIQALWSRDFLRDIQYDYFYYLAYFGNQLLPFVIVTSLPKMRSEIREHVRGMATRVRIRNRVNPAHCATTTVQH